MTGRTSSATVPGRLAALCLAAAVLVGGTACNAQGDGNRNKGAQVTDTATARPNASESGTAPASQSADGTSPSPSTDGSSPGGTPGSADPATPSAAATALSWKSYSDPEKKVSFDVPQEWIVQSVTPDAGTLPGALKVEVKDASGRYIATLQTGLPAADAADCPAGQSHPYVVVSSVPIDVAHSGGPGTIEPRVVFRVVQGYRFFGSFGITNVVAGADGQACELRNRVEGPAGKGDFSFGDVAVLHAFAADEKVAPAKAFDTLDLAAKYVAQGTEFANVQRMLLSLKVNL
ncbi:hypothetical protein ACIPY2_02545 [Paenarthrobacter sp. NPDC089675]|uniref:hypothetical protein n=1 Tax=Paenarthrobacter sp. NPDC089675 TaxID=3364376 RepID=UPI00381FD8C4